MALRYGVANLRPKVVPRRKVGQLLGTLTVVMLSENLRTILARSDIAARIGTMGIEPYYASSEETAAFIRADLSKWHEMARDAGIVPQ